MKKLSFLFLIATLGTIQSCSKLNDIRSIDLNADLPKSFTVNITEADPLTVSQTFTVDAGDNAKIQKYLNHIKKYTIKKVTYQIKDYSGASGIVLTGNLNFGSITYEISSLNLGAASTAQTVFEIPFEQADLDAIAVDLEDGNTLSGTIEGSVSDKPVTFTIEVTVSVVVNADVV